MTKTKLRQNESYEWYGTFWFPIEDDEETEQFSGKLSYTPDSGIKISISSIATGLKDALERDLITKKIMHGVVHGDTLMTFTLFNVFLSKHGSFGNPNINIMEGLAGYLVADTLLETDEVAGISCEYDDHLNNFFMIRKKVDSNELSKQPALQLNDKLELSVITPFSGETVYKDELETIFYSHEEEAMNEMREALNPILEKHPYSFINKNKQNVSFNFKCKDELSSLKEITKHEHYFRNFIESMIDHKVNLNQLMVRIMDNEDNKTSLYSALWSPYYQRKDARKPSHFHMLKIKLSTFSNGEYKLSNIQKSLENWISLNQNIEWKRVLSSLDKAFCCKDTLSETTHYASLVSEIETFLDLIEAENTHLDTLINTYASEWWISEFEKLSNPTRNTETLGKWAQEVRNVIVHPKSCKKKSNGKYWNLANDEMFLQSLYAYLSGLLLKAFINEQMEVDLIPLEEYCQNFIKTRIYYTVEYD